jgi:hypothetical protein
MSSYSGIEAVSTTLKELLHDVMNNPADPDVTGTVGVNVGLPPSDAELASGLPRLNLFLYRVTENGELRNQEAAGHDLPGRGGRPPLWLNLHYLLTAYASSSSTGGDGAHDDRVAQRLLGRSMRILYDNAVITRALLDHYGITDLTADFERVKLTLEPLSVEDVSKVWTALNRPYRLAAAYEARVVEIDSLRPARHPRPVGPRPAGPSVRVLPGTAPTLVDIASAVRPGPYAKAGEEVVLLGRNLMLDTPHVILGGTDAPVTSARDDRLTFVVPDVPTVQPGILPARVVAEGMLGRPPAPHRISASNSVALVVIPSVTAASRAGGTIRIEGDRLVSDGVECLALVGDAAVVRADYTLDSPAAIEFLRPAAAGSGSRPVRVRVAGAESLDAVTVTL